MTTFSLDYAALYDLLHENKPYPAEVDLVLEHAQTALGHRPARVLELACGTGHHMVELMRRGVFVHGNDLSPNMIAHAQNRVAAHGDDHCSFSVSPMQALDEEHVGVRPFELATAFYTALGYLTQANEWVDFLAVMRKLLAPKGLLFADLWSGHKMAREFSPSRTRDFNNARMQVRRQSQVEHRPAANVLDVRFDFDVTEKPSGHRRSFSENHSVRYFTEAEIRTLLELGGFRVVASAPFFDTATRIEDAWNFWIMAQRV